jgi:hypothetical protein
MRMAGARRWAGVVVALLAAARPRATADEPDPAKPVADDPTLIALAVALSCSEPPATAEGQDGAAGAPEIELVATVRARSLRLDTVPRLDGALLGGAGRRTAWRTERVNLPERPEPGVAYHDVEVRITLRTDVDGLAAMLREAKRAARGLRLDEADPPPQAAALSAQPVVPPEMVGSVAPTAVVAAPSPPPPASSGSLPPPGDGASQALAKPLPPATSPAAPIPTVLDDGPSAATTTGR